MYVYMYFITEKKGGKKKRRHIRHKRKEGSSAWYAKAFFSPGAQRSAAQNLPIAC